MNRAARMAIDVGSVRIGVAVAPAGTSLAVPVETVPRGPGDVARIAALAAEHGTATVFVGDPITLSGHAGPAAQDARAFAGRLAAALPPDLEVRMVDERLTTAQSLRSLADAGRNTRRARRVVDQQAAAAILQNALDTETATGSAAGTAVRTRSRGT